MISKSIPLRKNINIFTNIKQKLTKFNIQLVSILLNNSHLIHKGDCLITKVPKLRSEFIK
jgi:hypothetical protein